MLTRLTVAGSQPAAWFDLKSLAGLYRARRILGCGRFEVSGRLKCNESEWKTSC